MSLTSAKEARELAKNEDTQKQVNYMDLIVELMGRINKEILKAAKDGQFSCKISCIREYALYDGKVVSTSYNNSIISEIRKRLTKLGYYTVIDRKKKTFETYEYNNLLIYWD